MRRGRVMMATLYPGPREMRDKSPYRKKTTTPITSQIMNELHVRGTREPTEDFRIFNNVFGF